MSHYPVLFSHKDNEDHKELLPERFTLALLVS